MRFNIIVAYEFSKYGIGKNNSIPWTIPEDIKYFKNITTKTNHFIDVIHQTEKQQNIQQNINTDPNTKIEHNKMNQNYPPDGDFIYHPINCVIMGRKTYDSIAEKYKPLSNRLNIVITNNPDHYNSNNPLLIYCKLSDLKETIIKFKLNNITTASENKIYQIYENFIIGGETIYKYAIENLDIYKIYTTEIYNNYNCDTKITLPADILTRYFIAECSNFKKTMDETPIYYRFITYWRNDIRCEYIGNIYKNTEEIQYLETMHDILTNGVNRMDRTGEGTISNFGIQLKYNLADTFPLATTKKMFFRAIFEELMLYLRGQTDNNILANKGIHIWDGNTSREFLDKRGLTHYDVGDMGETYGFNFRHFGGNYKGCKHNPEDPSLQGFDQLSDVINLIKNDPTSRRIIINLWNPNGNPRAALPSCLCMYQFYVDTVRKLLHLQIYIRSSDYFLANNWNTCTGALLTHLICNLDGIDLTAGMLTVCVGDAHIYNHHIDAVRENLAREPLPFPKLLIKERKTDITQFEFKDLDLLGYRAYPAIKAKMAI